MSGLSETNIGSFFQSPVMSNVSGLRSTFDSTTDFIVPGLVPISLPADFTQVLYLFFFVLGLLNARLYYRVRSKCTERADKAVRVKGSVSKLKVEKGEFSYEKGHIIVTTRAGEIQITQTVDQILERMQAHAKGMQLAQALTPPIIGRGGRAHEVAIPGSVVRSVKTAPVGVVIIHNAPLGQTFLGESIRGGGFRCALHGNSDLLWTAAHVLEALLSKQQEILLRANGSDIVLARSSKVIFYSPSDELDLIAVKLDRRTWSTLGVRCLAFAKNTFENEVVTALTIDSLGEFSKSKGQLRAAVAPCVISHTASTEQGSSGTPILNIHGKVVLIHADGDPLNPNPRNLGVSPHLLFSQHESANFDDDYEFKKLTKRLNSANYDSIESWKQQFGIDSGLELENLVNISEKWFFYRQQAQFIRGQEESYHLSAAQALADNYDNSDDVTLEDIERLAETLDQYKARREEEDDREFTSRVHAALFSADAAAMQSVATDLYNMGDYEDTFTHEAATPERKLPELVPGAATPIQRSPAVKVGNIDDLKSANIILQSKLTDARRRLAISRREEALVLSERLALKKAAQLRVEKARAAKRAAIVLKIEHEQEAAAHRAAIKAKRLAAQAEIQTKVKELEQLQETLRANEAHVIALKAEALSAIQMDDEDQEYEAAGFIPTPVGDTTADDEDPEETKRPPIRRKRQPSREPPVKEVATAESDFRNGADATAAPSIPVAQSQVHGSTNSADTNSIRPKTKNRRRKRVLKSDSKSPPAGLASQRPTQAAKACLKQAWTTGRGPQQGPGQ